MIDFSLAQYLRFEANAILLRALRLENVIYKRDLSVISKIRIRSEVARLTGHAAALRKEAARMEYICGR